MKNVQYHTGTIDELKRLPSSINGNARFEGVLVTGSGIRKSFRTAVDSDLADDLKNYRDGQVVMLGIGVHYNYYTLDSYTVVTESFSD